MSDYISWNKEDDALFREYYFQKTGEKIQDEPIDLDSKFEIGSSRLSAESKIELLNFIGVAIDGEPSAYKNATRLSQEAETLLLLQNL